MYCRDLITYTDIYATIVAQPKDARCKIVKTAATDEPMPGPKTGTFRVEIFQSVCFASGVYLEARILEDGDNTTDYAFDWQIDGKPAGNSPKIDCACGKTAQLTVTHRKSGKSVRKTVELPDACKAKE